MARMDRNAGAGAGTSCPLKALIASINAKGIVNSSVDDFRPASAGIVVDLAFTCHRPTFERDTRARI